MRYILYALGACFIAGGVVPFLWYFLPSSRSGFETSKEAEEWGRFCLQRNKRIAPQICADTENPDSWR